MKNNNPLISIIIPVYNSSAYLYDCLVSVVEQSYSNLDIIIIDDCSSDRSIDICNEFKKNDGRIRLIKNKKNSGAAYCRNIGVNISKGEYVCFIDSDDVVSNDYVEYMFNNIAKKNYDISIACYTVKSDNKLYYMGSGKSTDISQKECLIRILMSDGISVSMCAKLFKKEVLSNIIFPEGYMYEDDAVIYQIIINSKKIYYGNKSVYTYFVRDNSVMTKQFTKKKLILLEYAENMKKLINNHFPDLKVYSEKKYIDYYFSILRQLVFYKCDDEIILTKKKVKKYLKSKILLILFSKIYNFKEKIAIFSLAIGEWFYKLLWIIFTRIKY